MSEFEFPTNIRQIGSIGDGMRIYVEDYVCSYLQQLADDVGNEERVAILVGRDMVIDGNPVLFISGAVQGMHAECDGDKIEFPEKMWQYSEQQTKKHFKGLEIVGWMLSQPGYGANLRQSASDAHKNYFPDKHQVVFITDPVERINAFYIWGNDKESLTEIRGYFVYYDKNRGMHEYMLEGRTEKKRSEGEGEEVKLTIPRIIEKRKTDSPEVVVRRKQNERMRKSTMEQKKIINMLVSLSAVLFLVCFIMGAGLIQNDGRISTLEQQLTGLNTAYRDVLVQIKDNRTTEVFATQTKEPQATLIEDDGNEALKEELLAQMGMIGSQTPEPTPSPTPEPTQAPTPEPTPAPTPEPTPAPTPTPTPSPPEEPNESASNTLEVWDTYEVEKGDTLSYISEKFYGTSRMADKIMEINELSDPHMIYFGKIIKLPVME